MFCTNLIMYDYAEIFLEIFAIFSKAIWSNLLEIMCLKGSFLHKLMESNCFFGEFFKRRPQRNNYCVIQKLFISCVSAIIIKYSFEHFRKAKKYSEEDHCVTAKKKIDKGADIYFVLTLSQRSVLNTIKRVLYSASQSMFKSNILNGNIKLIKITQKEIYFYLLKDAFPTMNCGLFFIPKKNPIEIFHQTFQSAMTNEKVSIQRVSFNSGK